MSDTISRIEPTKSHTANFMSTSGWLVILVATLTMSTYSLLFVGIHIGIPAPFAALGSCCFDGTAILASVYALRYAELGLTGTGPRTTLFIFAGASASLNAYHAVIGHEPRFAMVWWIGPPIAAVLVLEFHLRYTRRVALQAHGLIAESFRPLGRRVWTDHPIEALRTRRAVSAERLLKIAQSEAPSYVAARTASAASAEQAQQEVERVQSSHSEISTARSKRAAIIAALDINPTASHREVTELLLAHGVTITEKHVRAERSRIARASGELPQLPRANVVNGDFGR
jgi:hypothetical protein